MSAPLDLFLSFHRSDAGPIRRLAAALEALGVATAAGGGRSSPTVGVPADLGAAKVVVAWGSEAYFRSRHCQAELAAAFIAGAREPATAPERLLLINGESGSKHIYPPHLRELVVAPAPGLTGSWPMEELAESLRDHCGSISGRLDRRGPFAVPVTREAFDIPVPASPRFEGRDRELWDIHDSLHPPGSDAARGGATVVVSAGGGQGKSALALEYAYRFGPAYPGGIYRLSAAEARPAASVADLGEMPALRVQLAALAEPFGIEGPVHGLDVPTLSRLLGEKLAEAGHPFLWIVDDLPDRLNGAAFRLWLAPAAAGALGRSLLLTRAGHYHQRATVIHLPPLDPHSAQRLLTRDSAPVGEAEREAAAGLVEELGRQPMGLAIAGELAHQDRRNRQGRYGALLRRLDSHGPAAEDLAARLPDAWPKASEVSLAATLLHGLAVLQEPGRDLLRLAAILPDVAISLDFAADCLARSGLGASGHRHRSFALFIHEPVSPPLDAESAAAHARDGAALLQKLSLGELTVHGIRAHRLAVRTMAVTDPEPARAQALERASLDALLGLVDADEPLAAWPRLAPYSASIRRLALDPPEETDAHEEMDLRGRRLRLACLLAEIDVARGARKEALRAYRAAAGYLLRTITEEPGNGLRQRDFAVIQERIGQLLEANGDLPGALDCYRKSLGVRILASQPGSPSRPWELLRHHEKIGALLEALDDPQGALQSYRAAHGFIEKRAAKKSEDPDRRFRVVTSHYRLAMLCRRLEDPAAAERSLIAASPLLEKLAAAHPDRLEFIQLRREIENGLGDAFLARKGFEEARRRYAAALAAAEIAARREPESLEIRAQLAQCHSRLGNALAALQKSDQAAARFRSFIALAASLADSANPDVALPRDVVLAHIKLGIALESLVEPDRIGARNEYRTAAEMLERLLETDPKHPQFTRDLTWVQRRLKILGSRDALPVQRAPAGRR